MDTYRIQYNDNTYQLVEWTEEQFHSVVQAMLGEYIAIVIDKSVFKLEDIRAIVYLPPAEPEPEEIKDDGKSNMIVTEMGTFEREAYELIRDLGYDVGKIIGTQGGE